MTEPAFDVQPDAASSLLAEVMDRSEQNLAACYQCRRCAAACSVADETGYLTPDRLIRMIATGDRENAINNDLVWQCVSCYKCGIRCPNNIQTGRITETLKKMAKESHHPTHHNQHRHERIAHFHDAFLTAGVRRGRVNETEFMGIYELKNTISNIKTMNISAIGGELAAQMQLGLAMLRLRRMHFKFLSAKGRKEIKQLYKRHKSGKSRYFG
ncbi:MAG: 4Fe-4S dicluster domain-containing protein [Thermodesulfobacteriota bacterium]|nr:4Fe-4S dicluster domain-containing protein [Thermodesulfobacteriota bacterium]